MTTSQAMFLRTKRVYIRPLLESDLAYLMRWFNDHDGVLNFLASPIPNTEAGERDWIARQKQIGNPPGQIVFMIVLNKGDIPIGTMGLHQIHWIDRSAITGAAIGEDKYRSRGFGSEAKGLLLHYAFQSLGLNRIQSSVNATNTRSIAYNKKCGYQTEGVMRQARYSGGTFIDSVVMSILREDWDKQQKSARTRG